MLFLPKNTQLEKHPSYSTDDSLSSPVINVPATQLAHFPDAYNHSAGDTLDKVDFDQLTNIINLVTGFLNSSTKTSEATRPQSPHQAIPQLNHESLSQIPIRTWEGPFNPLGFITSLPKTERENYLQKIRQNKHYYSIILQIGMHIDSVKPLSAIRFALKQKLKTRFDTHFIEQFLSCLNQHGWIQFDSHQVI